MPFIQVPPDSTGKLVETSIPNAASSLHRELLIVSDATSTAVATVTSSAGLQVSLSTSPITVVSASSGLIQALTTGPLLVLTSGTLITQVTGTSGGIAPVTTSG